MSSPENTTEALIERIDNLEKRIKVLENQNKTKRLPKPPSSSNTSGRTGVTIMRQGELTYWQAKIQINGKYHYLGNFKEKDDAIKARQEAEIKFFGATLEQMAEREAI